mmetsp:Transcript_69243/g.225544  ORF Transcript_69243/g.225544 Transcript_69243/m.225544 type:complete len:298 (-) Transcript_69243:119-1012(-)
MVLLVLAIHRHVALRCLVHDLQEEGGDLPQVRADAEADVPADRADALDVLLLLRLRRGRPHIRQQRAHERVQLPVCEDGRECANAGNDLLPQRRLVLLGLQQIEQRIRHVLLVRPLHDPVVPEALQEVVEDVGALLFDLHERVRGDAMEHLGEHILARQGAAGCGELGEQALEAGRVDVAHLRFAVKHQLAQLRQDLTDLLLLKLTHNLRQALDSIALNINALVLELLEEGLAHPLLEVEIKHLIRIRDLLHQVRGRHKSLVLVPILHLFQELGYSLRIHGHLSRPARLRRRQPALR